MSWFISIEHAVVNFFHTHGQAILLDIAKKIVPEVEAEVKKAIAAAKAEGVLILPIVEAYLSKYAPEAEVKAFLESSISTISADLPAVYQKVAAFVMAKLAGGSSVAHLINLAIEYIYSTVVKVA